MPAVNSIFFRIIEKAPLCFLTKRNILIEKNGHPIVTEAYFGTFQFIVNWERSLFFAPKLHNSTNCVQHDRIVQYFCMLSYVAVKVTLSDVKHSRSNTFYYRESQTTFLVLVKWNETTTKKSLYNKFKSKACCTLDRVRKNLVMKFHFWSEKVAEKITFSVTNTSLWKYRKIEIFKRKNEISF